MDGRLRVPTFTRKVIVLLSTREDYSVVYKKDTLLLHLTSGTLHRIVHFVFKYKAITFSIYLCVYFVTQEISNTPFMTT